MWLVTQKKMMINMDIYEKVFIQDKKIIFQSTFDKDIEIEFENEENALTSFGYILQALKRKEEVTNL